MIVCERNLTSVSMWPVLKTVELVGNECEFVSAVDSCEYSLLFMSGYYRTGTHGARWDVTKFKRVIEV